MSVHWITISNIGCQDGVVNVYDSMPNCDIPRRTKEQLAAILFWKKNHFRLQFQAVQEQRGGSDCGLFAVAFATSLCVGDDPTLITYKQQLLRKHLCECLEKRMMTTFPKTARPRKPSQPRAVVQCSVYCSCRLPECGRMIQCDGCTEWYHEECINAPSSVWMNTNSTWYCCACSK